MVYSIYSGPSKDYNIKTESVHCLSSKVSREKGEIQLRHSRKEKKRKSEKSVVFLFVVVIHSDFSTPLNLLYTSKIQGKSMSFYIRE